MDPVQSVSEACGETADHSGIDVHAEAKNSLQVVAVKYREILMLLKQRNTLRQANLHPERPDEITLKKLDSSVKRNSALVKKLRQTSEDSKDSLIDEIKRTNQSKYVAEARSAIIEANIKPRDINAVVQVASALHQRYAEFGNELASSLAHNLLAHPAEWSGDAEVPSMAKQRAWLRLLAELQAIGIAQDSKLVVSVVQKIGDRNFHNDRSSALSSLSVLAAFARAGREDYLGMPLQLPSLPEGIEVPSSGAPVPGALAEEHKQILLLVEACKKEMEPGSNFALSPSGQQEICNILLKCFEAGCATLEEDHRLLVETEEQNLRALNNRGELPEEMAMQYEAQRKAVENLHRTLASLGETLDRKLPTLESANTTRLKGPGIVEVVSSGAVPRSSGPFDDDETRAFYESLPNLQALIPAVLLTKGEPASKQDKVGADDEVRQTAADRQDTHVGGEASAAGTRAEVEAALHQIMVCGDKAAADEAALAFCYVNGKGPRRRLARLLLESRIALHQLPFCARVVATLAQVFPDISLQVLQGLQDEQSKLMAKKETTVRVTEDRLRNARFLAELTIFRICPYGSFFTILKSLLDDFSGTNIDTAAALVETGGRFLILLAETHQRMENMLEVMMKLRNSRNIDARQSLAVDSAFWTCKPPERAALRHSRRPPQEQYMRHLVLDILSRDTLEHVVKKLRKFSWAENEQLIVKCILSGVGGRFAEISVLVSMVASLSKYHPSLGVKLADALLEEIRLGLETPELGKYQRRVGHLRLLGELYNYRLMNSKTIFQTLDLLLTSGHSSPEEAEKLDAPTNYFRIRLVCTLLSSCGHYFSKGSTRHRLDCFLVYFQRYVLHKPPLPLDIEFDVQDLLEHLRPKLQRFSDFEEACKAVEALEAEGASDHPSNVFSPDQSDSEDGSSTRGQDHRGGAELDGEDHEADAESLPIDEDEDDQVLFSRPGNAAPIDQEFEKELDALTLRSASSADAQQRGDSDMTADGSDATVAFKVMLRRGGKEDRSRAIQVPASLALAVKSREDRAVDAAERAELKRLVLQASQQDIEPSSDRSHLASEEQEYPRRRAAKASGYHARGGGRMQGSKEAARGRAAVRKRAGSGEDSSSKAGLEANL